MKEGWVNKKLWEILVFDKRFNGISKEKQKKVASFVHVSAEKLKELKVEEGTVRLISTGLFDGFTTEELAGDYLNKGEIITIPTGGVANIKYYEGKFVDSGNIIGIAGIKDLKIKYVYYFLLFKKEEVDSFFRGVGIKHPYMPDICEMIIPLPTEKEQEKIILQLDLLQSLINKQQAQLKELDNLALSFFYEMFGDPIGNEKGWEEKTIKDVGKVVTGNTPSRQIKEYYDNPYIEWIKSDNLSNERVFASSAKEYLSKLGASKARILPPGSILVTCIAGSLSTIGTASLVNRSVSFNQQINAIIPNENIASNLFVLHTIRRMGKTIREHATNGMKHIITKKVFEEIPIILPPLSLQQSFAEKIEAIEKQKANISKSIEETQKLFDYTMDKYFG